MHFHGHIEKVGNQCKLGQCLLTYARAHPAFLPELYRCASTFCSVVSDFLKMKAMNNSERDAWLMSLFATKQNRLEVAKYDHHGLPLCRTCVAATIGICAETMRQKVSQWNKSSQ